MIWRGQGEEEEGAEMGEKGEGEGVDDGGSWSATEFGRSSLPSIEAEISFGDRSDFSSGRDDLRLPLRPARSTYIN